MSRKPLTERIIEAAHRFNQQMGYPPGLLRIAPNAYQSFLDEVGTTAGQHYALERGTDGQVVEMFFGMKVKKTTNMVGFVCLSGVLPVEKQVVEEYRNPTLSRFVKAPETRIAVHNQPRKTQARNCLVCDNSFRSLSIENRVCDRCKDLPDWRYGGGL